MDSIIDKFLIEAVENNKKLEQAKAAVKAFKKLKNHKNKKARNSVLLRLINNMWV